MRYFLFSHFFFEKSDKVVYLGVQSFTEESRKIPFKIPLKYNGDFITRNRYRSGDFNARINKSNRHRSFLSNFRTLTAPLENIGSSAVFVILELRKSFAVESVITRGRGGSIHLNRESICHWRNNLTTCESALCELGQYRKISFGAKLGDSWALTRAQLNV